MERCRIQIHTETDGAHSRAAFEGEWDEARAALTYRDGGAAVTIALGDGVSIRRRGDYSLDLLLKAGERTCARLGFGDSAGDIPLLTEGCAVARSSAALRIRATYALEFSHSVQKMRLYLVATFR